ncbi:hypothetical protein J4461_02990 [Candidatus Pacearchaeota archaeon]|nr:hypothetical protein [Candidatus Pacearchaeota archaeon]
METDKAAESAHSQRNWYDKSYKILLLIPIILVALSLLYLVFFYIEHGDIVLKDASLSGGTTITIRGEADSDLLENSLKSEFDDIYVRKITDLRTGRLIAVVIDSGIEPELLKPAVEKILGYKLNSDNSTVEFTGPSLSNNFYKQLLVALLFSFILICIVIFSLFRTLIPSLAVIFAVIGDIIMPLALINFLGINLSAAGIAAFLMLIGYSVDTDILLTTRVLKKREGSVNERIYGAFKTGMFMTIVGLLAVLPAFFIVTGLPDSFRQIFLILSMGLFADILNTWLTNASILKWYTEVKKHG